MRSSTRAGAVTERGTTTPWVVTTDRQIPAPKTERRRRCRPEVTRETPTGRKTPGWPPRRRHHRPPQPRPRSLLVLHLPRRPRPPHRQWVVRRQQRPLHRRRPPPRRAPLPRPSQRQRLPGRLPRPINRRPRRTLRHHRSSRRCPRLTTCRYRAFRRGSLIPASTILPNSWPVLKWRPAPMSAVCGEGPGTG